MLEPAYVAAILAGLRDAAKKQWDASWWPPVLELCQAAVDHPQVAESVKQPEYGWRWARQTVAGLLTVGLSEDPARFSIGLRDAIWSILKPFKRRSGTSAGL